MQGVSDLVQLQQKSTVDSSGEAAFGCSACCLWGAAASFTRSCWLSPAARRPGHESACTAPRRRRACPASGKDSMGGGGNRRQSGKSSVPESSQEEQWWQSQRQKWLNYRDFSTFSTENKEWHLIELFSLVPATREKSNFNVDNQTKKIALHFEITSQEKKCGTFILLGENLVLSVRNDSCFLLTAFANLGPCYSHFCFTNTEAIFLRRLLLTWIDAKVMAAQMTYIMISFNFFTTRASQPCDRKQTNQRLHRITDNTTHENGCSVVLAACLYLLVELSWSSESSSTVTDAGLTAADRNAVVLGLLKPTRVSPVRVVVNATAVKLK